MDGKSLQEHAKRVALEMPFTEHCWPFGPEYDAVSYTHLTLPTIA